MEYSLVTCRKVAKLTFSEIPWAYQCRDLIVVENMNELLHGPLLGGPILRALEVVISCSLFSIGAGLGCGKWTMHNASTNLQRLRQ